MKKLILIFFAILLISCKKNNKTYNLTCYVKNAEGLELVFSIEGQDFEKKQVKKVKDGKVIFQLSDTIKETGYIESLYNLQNFNSQRRFVKVLPEKNDLSITFNIVKDSTEIDENDYAKIFSFRNLVYNTPGNNTKFSEINNKIRIIEKDIVLSFPKLDSLNKFVFPDLKTKMLYVYKKNVFENNNIEPVLKIEILNSLLRKYSFFSEEYFTRSEKESVILFFNEIKNENLKTKTFKMVEQKINDLKKVEEEIVFKDFIFEDISHNKVSLSKIIEDNQYTVLYFWTAGCGPCKSFNNKLPSKINTLKDNNIKIVHINVDLMREYWLKATKRDSIFWTNLYAGRDVVINNHYKVNQFPTKVIFNNKKETINFSFSNPEELLELKNIK